jgi:hypothetical protein
MELLQKLKKDLRDIITPCSPRGEGGVHSAQASEG